METYFADGEPWKKVFGPFLVYLNSDPHQGNYSALWEDAKRQMLIDAESWPYNFTQSEDFPPSSQRGTVTGQLLIRDRYISKKDLWADSAYVGLAAPGEAGSWQTETKGYQFWARADTSGSFTITNVRAGAYNLYAWVPGTVGDYKYETTVTVTPGSLIKLGSLVYESPRSGPTLWEIGYPDRTAAEFHVPNPSPLLLNKLYVNLKPDWFRQYGLWERYGELYPEDDLVFTVGTSKYQKDWFFAHVTRNKGNSTFEPTTWQVKFELRDVSPKETYTLQLALASATFSEIQVRFNDPKMGKPLFTTMLIGSDNAIARHGIHGVHHFYSIQVPGSYLQKGSNTLYLTQARARGLFEGVMYDYLRLEGPPNSL
ncbi:hypothetical protein CRG98_018154 [Punica granatum]|nr:hypothetical protein CRG98_018154 [Punica granatum]